MAWQFVAMAGCNFSAQQTASTHAIDLFHGELDSANYHAIWNDTGSEMRAVTTEPVFGKLLVTVHGKLGKVVKSEQVGINVNYNTGGTFTTTTMQTQFEHGTGQEVFVFKSTDHAPELVGYHINSNDLMTLL
jgi:hypothetical protein